MSKTLKILCVGLVIVLMAVSFFAGRMTAGKEKEIIKGLGTTFYATITDKNDNYFTVEGLSVNDINGRGEFTFTVDEDTVLEWRHTEITKDELEIGDNISITHTGEILTIYPATIVKVLRVQLLDDEK